jgi:tRNA1(Val) A37 N6-methylase TrmN6
MFNKNNMINLDIKQNFKPNPYNKINYGEVNTPFFLIIEILNLFPKDIFTNPNLKWLDPAAGCGYFSMVLYNFLMDGLETKIKNREKRKKHILENMIYMCEINEFNINLLKTTFGNNSQIYHFDFLSTSQDTFNLKNEKFDIIIGNPPYNSKGLKKVPTNLILNKKQDGITLWTDFIKHSISLLRENGFLSMIIPSIWMKPDKAKMYNYITQYKLHKIKCFTNTQTKLIFNNQAQTPTCYFLLQNSIYNNKDNQDSIIISLYDELYKSYIPFTFIKGSSIPLLGASIVQKVRYYADKFGTFNVVKTNLPGKYNELSNTYDEKHCYTNIKTTLLDELKPKLVLQYSNKPCIFHGEKKIILSHKMYGFPFFDKTGFYGISNRDNYVITNYNDEDFIKVFNFLNTKLILFLYETTRYRMKYLEKYVFEFIPNILKINDFPEEINDYSVNSFFNFSQDEIQYIMNFHKKYSSFTIS